MKRIIFFTILVALIISLHLFGFFSPLENFILKTSKPAGGVFYGFFGYLNNIYENYLKRNDLGEENRRLRDRVRELIIERAEMNVLQEENVSLKKTLSFFEEKEYKNITARVIGKTVEGDIKTIIINKGSNDGVEENLPIVAEGGIMVGKVIKTTPLTSTILLLPDGSSKIAGMIQNNTKTIGIIRGGYGIGVRMEFIPQGEMIKSDEIVVTSGLEIEIPRGLAVGTVESVIKDSHTPFQTIIIKPLIDYGRLDIVSVLFVN